MGDIKTREINIHYQEKGKGKRNLVFLHGGLNSSRIWGNVLDLIPEEFSSFALDTRGCGDSGRGEDYSLDTLSQDVSDFMQGLSIDKASIIGHCLGGNIAILFAHRFPQKVEKLILSDTFVRKSALSDLMSRDEIKGLMESEAAKGLLGGEGISIDMLNWGLLKVLMDFFFCEPDRLAFSRVTSLMEGFARADIAGALKSMSSLLSFDLEEELKKIKSPLLVIHGAEDKLYPVDEGKFISESVLQGRLQVIPDSGHFPHVERPQDFASALLEFL
jgi:pimeloyl-ACP methyl ester carboxylesterase